MSSGADLFVVCKQCGSEVSPYVTECPYCGNRLRRRAPKLPRPGEQAAPNTRRQGLGRLLGGSRGGARARARRPGSPLAAQSRWSHLRPHATIALVGASCVLLIVTTAEPVLFVKMAIVGPLGGSWWKLLTYPFAYVPKVSGVYVLAAVAVTGLFGWLLEQRHGPGAVLAVFFGAGLIGGLAALAVYPLPVACGANAAAMGLLAAWAVPDLRASRADAYYEGDLLGTAAIAALLLALPFAAGEASWLAGVAGGAVGLVAGYALSGPARSGDLS